MTDLYNVTYRSGVKSHRQQSQTCESPVLFSTSLKIIRRVARRGEQTVLPMLLACRVGVCKEIVLGTAPLSINVTSVLKIIATSSNIICGIKIYGSISPVRFLSPIRYCAITLFPRESSEMQMHLVNSFYSA